MMFRYIPEVDLRFAFNDVQKRQTGHMGVIEKMMFKSKMDFSRPLEELIRDVADQCFAEQQIIVAVGEDDLLRQLRYEGLRPGGTPIKLVRLFDLTRDFEIQRGEPAEDSVAQNLSPAGQHAYARYLGEVERKYALPLKNKGTGSTGPL